MRILPLASVSQFSGIYCCSIYLTNPFSWKSSAYDTALQNSTCMKNLPTQQEIMKNWQQDPAAPVVSICCITYNHGPYIEEALQGFLIQETDFPFEILVHDDASTDNTPDIIRRYHKAYPNLIRPVYQTKNHYSRGINPDMAFNQTRARGEYLALCEGDDFWT